MTENNLTGQTPDIAAQNIEQLKQIFPDVFAEGKIDFQKLQQVLGEYIETENERYNFGWNGKAKSLRLAQTPSTGTLRPCKEESKEWDTTGNLYIEGDNLEVLKLLQKSYHNKVKMIYIDPPYNTGNDFVYPDDYRDNLQNYLELTGQVDSDNRKLSTNTDKNGRYHTDWLNMMYPRLRLARNLLTDDGVIFISIDDNEQKNLKSLCDEVFGEENFLVNAIWISGRTSSAHFTHSHEYVIGYAKNKNHLPLFPFTDGEKTILDRTIKKPGIKNPLSNIEFPTGIDFDCEDKVFPSKFGESEPVEIVKGIFECKDGKLKNPVVIRAAWAMKDMIGSWLKGEEVIDQKGQKVIRFFFKSNGVLQYEKSKGTIHPNSVVTNITTKSGTNEIKKLLNEELFPYPKPTNLIKYFSPASYTENKDSFILDFFSGSATTAHAVMQLNAEDGGNRKFIMVQLPEQTDEKSEAFKAGYKNICEIGKERIRRAGEKINLEIKNNNSQTKIDEQTKQPVDIGFKVLKLDSSNIKKWNTEDAYDRNKNDQLEFNQKKFEQILNNQTNNYVDGRTELDVVYEIMVKYGLDLTYCVDEYDCNGKKVYSIGVGALMICIDNEVTTDVADYILKIKAELKPEKIRVVFKNNGFKDDSNKTNVKEILKCGGIDEFVTL